MLRRSVRRMFPQALSVTDGHWSSSDHHSHISVGVGSPMRMGAHHHHHPGNTEDSGVGGSTVAGGGSAGSTGGGGAHRSAEIMARIDMLEREIILMKHANAALEHNRAVAAVQPSAISSSGEPRSPETFGTDVCATTQNQQQSEPIPVYHPASAWNYNEFDDLTDDLRIPLSTEAFDDLHQYSSKQPQLPTRVFNLMQQKNEKDLIRGANLLRREYKVRLAHSAKALTMAPFGLATMPSLVELRKWYEVSFRDLHHVGEITDREGLLRYSKLLRKVFRRHWNTSDLLSAAMHEFSKREMWTAEHLDDPRLYNHFSDLQRFFDGFCGTRTALRLLVNHHMMNSEHILRIDPNGVHPRSRANHFGHDPADFAGAVCKKCSVPLVMQYAIDDALKEFYSPEDRHEQPVEIEVAGDPNHTFPTFPGLIFDVATALVAEAARANFIRSERYGTMQTPIRVLISQSSDQQDCVVRIEDTAGGMPNSVTRNSMSYLASCRSFFEDQDLCGTSSHIQPGMGWRHSPIRLPYAAVAAQVIGAQISVASVDGHGTDRCLYIPMKNFDDLHI